MINNSIFVHLVALKRKEMTRFAAFADSPYFNKHRDVRALVSYFSEIYPEFTGKNCDRTVLFKILFPNDTGHNQAQLAIVFSYTQRLLEQFMVVDELSQGHFFEHKTLYFKQLRKRNLRSLLHVEWQNSIEKSVKLSVSKDFADVDIAQAHLENSQVIAEKDAISLALGVPKLDHLLEKQRHLDAYYLIEKLRDACEIMQRSRLQKAAQPNQPLLENLLESLAQNPAMLNENPVLDTYLQVYNLLKNNDLARFKSCVLVVQQNEWHFHREAAQGLYNYLQNCCIEQINRGDADFLRELFSLYQLQLNNGLLLEEGMLPEWHFKNIVTTGLRLDERIWVRDFLENYRLRLAPAVAHNAYSYNLAAYYYHTGQPKAVLPLLIQVEYTDLRYNLDAKALLLRTYFDLSEDEALMAHVEAFTQFVKRNKSLTDFQKKGYFNLVKLTKRAFKLKSTLGFAEQKKWLNELQKLEMDLANAETIFNRSWLVSKIVALRSA